MTSYAEQIAPKLVIGSRSHELFANDTFLEALKAASPGLTLTLLLGETDPRLSLERQLAAPAENPPVYAPSAADEVALFQLPVAAPVRQN